MYYILNKHIYILYLDILGLALLRLRTLTGHQPIIKSLIEAH